MNQEEITLQANVEYGEALEQAKVFWGKGAPPEVLNAAAATILIHMDKLREAAKRDAAKGAEAKANQAARESAPSRTETGAPPAPSPAGPYAPTEKQIAFFTKLMSNGVFTEEVRKQAMEWLATKATRQSIKDQIDWAKAKVDGQRAVTPPSGGGRW